MIWELFIDSMTDKLRVICTILAFIVPFGVYKVNIYLHKVGDPPWKKEDTKKAKEET